MNKLKLYFSLIYLTLFQIDPYLKQKLTYSWILYWCRFAFVVLMHDCRRFFAVNTHMFLQVSTFTESLATNVTNIWALT